MPQTSAFPIHKAIDPQPPMVSQAINVSSALEVMQSYATSYVLVVTEQKKLIGIFTERDLVRIIAEGVSLEGQLLADVIALDVVSIQEHNVRDLLEVLALLSQHNIRHLPIVTVQNEVAGVITQESIRELLNPVDLLRLRQVHEVMVKNVICAGPETSVLSLVQLMNSYRVSCIVISETDVGQTFPVGVVTERDVVRLWSMRQDYQHLLAKEVMSAPLFPISSQETLWNAHKLMQNCRVRRLVVVDNRGILEGLVTQTTLLQMLDPVEAHITIETLQNIIYERTVSLHKANKELYKKVLERKRAKAALQKQIARERLLNRISQKIRQSLNVDEILTTTVVEVRQFLEANRAFIYQFNSPEPGKVVIESVEDGCLPIQGYYHLEADLSQLNPEFYQKGRIHSIPDWEALTLPAHETQLVRRFQIRSSLIAPILERDNLWGLVILNQCCSPRRWEKLEIDLLKQLATQVGIALQQAHLYAQLEAANERLKHLAGSDGLTQVANRRRFDEVFQTEWLRMAREQQPLSLILCDVDYFKVFNDTYGHQAGDDCLKFVAQAIQAAARRPADLVARYGGEEFVMILSNTPHAGAIQVAQAIQAGVKALAISHQGSRVSQSVTLSLGVASTIPQPGRKADALLAAADRALYQAKSEGRDRISTNLLSG